MRAMCQSWIFRGVIPARDKLSRLPGLAFSFRDNTMKSVQSVKTPEAVGPAVLEVLKLEIAIVTNLVATAARAEIREAAAQRLRHLEEERRAA